MFAIESSTVRSVVTVFVAVSLVGCSATLSRRYERLHSEFGRVDPPPPATLRRVARDRSPSCCELTIDERNYLDRTAFVQSVLRRNPSVEAARQAWRAAIAEYPQARAFPDPMLEYSLAPGTIPSGGADFGQRIQISQRFPGPRTRALQGEIALAEAEASSQDYESVRQDLALIAVILFEEYYAVTRALELNEEHHRLVENIKAIAEAHYEAGHASQHEPLQAELELAHVIHQRVVLGTERSVIVAQMNGLLHRGPEHALPPPPPQTDLVVDEIRDAAELQSEAERNRPDLRARQFRVDGREAAVELAHREYYPDVGVMASYNSMWMQPEHQWMVGLSLELPLQFRAQRAAVERAEAELAETRARLSSLDTELMVSVETARLRLLEAIHVARLYEERLLPAARGQIDAAQIGYETGRSSFQGLIDAERSIRRLELEYQEALATVGRRRAELERALGLVPGVPHDRRAP